MKWNNNNIQGMVAYINQELKNGRHLAGICVSDFNVGEMAINNRLENEGYVMSENQYMKETEDSISELIDYNKLYELQGLLEPLKALLDGNSDPKAKYDYNKLTHEELTKKTYRLDSSLADKWDKYCVKAKKKNNKTRVQDLVEKALIEYMNNNKL